MTYQCTTCGQTHEELPDMAFRWPNQYFAVPEGDRVARVKGNTDICAIDEKAFLVRGVILVPIVGTSGHFGIGVWVSQSPVIFRTYLDNYNSAAIGPFFGWLCNSIPFYTPDTWAMKTMVHFQGNNKRPVIELEPADHPLYRDYSQGVTLDRAWSIAHARYPGTEAAG
jgi:hypothetical protein